MADKEEFAKRLADKRAQYAKNFRIEDLNDANDASLLEISLKTELMIEDLQAEIQELIGEDAVGNATNIKKLADLLRDATATITTVQKTLAIDRKTRKDEEAGSVADYIAGLKKTALLFVDKRLVKLYCKKCKVMVGRWSPVHEHTAFNVQVQCSQCKEMLSFPRAEKPTDYDIPDAGWRRAYRAEVVQPSDSGPDEEIYYSDDDAQVIEFEGEVLEDTITVTPIELKDEEVIEDATREESD